MVFEDYLCIFVCGSAAGDMRENLCIFVRGSDFCLWVCS
jgi:hypothetical protein